MDHPRGVKVPSSLSPQPSRPWLDPLLGMLAAAAWVVFWAVVDWLWPTLPPWIPFAGKVATLGAVGAALARWRARSLTDPLTGLGNRRVLQVELDRTLALAKRYGHPLAVVLIDVNDFKAINDTPLPRGRRPGPAPTGFPSGNGTARERRGRPYGGRRILVGAPLHRRGGRPPHGPAAPAEVPGRYGRGAVLRSLRVPRRRHDPVGTPGSGEPGPVPLEGPPPEPLSSGGLPLGADDMPPRQRETR